MPNRNSTTAPSPPRPRSAALLGGHGQDRTANAVPGHQQRGQLVRVPDRARDAGREVVLVGGRVQDRGDRRERGARQPRPREPLDVLALPDRGVDDQEQDHVLEVAPRGVDRPPRILRPVRAQQRPGQEQHQHERELRMRAMKLSLLLARVEMWATQETSSRKPATFRKLNDLSSRDQQQLEERQERERAQAEGQVHQHDHHEREPEGARDRVLGVDAGDHAHQDREHHESQVPGRSRAGRARAAVPPQGAGAPLAGRRPAVRAAWPSRAASG